MRTCTKCGATKPTSDFYFRASQTVSVCKTCARAANRQWHAENRERHLQMMRRYRAEHLEEDWASSREWYKANTQRHRELGKRWLAANPERRKEIQTAYAERNRALVNERVKAWAKAHPDKRAESEAQRRARKQSAEVETVDRLAVIQRDQGRCHFCGKKCRKDEIHLDHLVPLSLGGSHTAANLRVACASCNLKSGPGRLPAQLLLVG